MKKKFLFTIEIQGDFPDQISPDFVTRIVSEVDRENRLPNYSVKTDNHQAFIDYVKNNEHILEECIAGDVYFNISSDGFADVLNQLLNPKWLDHIALENADKLDNETRDFIINLYKEPDEDNEDSKIDEEGNPLPNSKQNLTDALKREIDTEIIQQSLLNYKITGISLKVIDKEPTPDEATKNDII
ncbi:MAG: hypothetical protein MUF15_15620 [Acidobacteria bacterium]|jgi:hypothetical protein|nr:hypothetical protein [Acidobacteriota bacterium]